MIDEILQHLLSGVTVGSIYAATALGLTLVYGLLKILHIAHAGVYVWGAYAGFYAYTYTGNPIVAGLASMAVAALLGVGIERVFYLRLLDKPRYVPLMVSIALFILMEELAANLFGHYPKGFHVEELPRQSINVGGLTINALQVVVVSIILSAFVSLWAILAKTRFGIASQALIQDMEVSQALGVNLYRVLDVNFALGSALAGLAGLIVGMYYSSIYPYMGNIVAYKALVVIVLGGFGSIAGALLGGIILGVSEEFLTAYLGHILPREAFAFIVLVLLLIARPQGLLGRGE